MRITQEVREYARSHGVAEAEAVRQGRLGFDAMLVVERCEMSPSHVYTAPCEGFRPGGGLYIYTPDAEGGELTCIYDAGKGMITTADLFAEVIRRLKKKESISSLFKF